MLADRYPDDRERGNAMGIALGGLALGVLGKGSLFILWRPTLDLEFGYRLSGFVWDKGICQCPPAQVGGSLHRGRTTITEPSI